MPSDDDYFTRDRAFLDQVREQLTSVQTLADLKRQAFFSGWRGSGPLIAQKIDRLTQHKVKADGSRDGRWIWENIKAFVGRRLSENSLVDANIACGLQLLIVHELGYEEFWKLGRDRRNRVVLHQKLKQNDPAQIALDILTILIEQKK